MYVSVIIVRAIVSALKRPGADPTSVLEALDVKPELLLDIRQRISFGEADRLVRRGLELSNDPGLGLTIASHEPESMLQVFGHVMVSCRTLRDAYELFERYLPLVVDGVSFQLRSDGTRARFEYHCPVQLGVTSRFAAEYVITMAQRIAAHFVPASQALEIRFEHDKPEYAGRYDALFSCPVHFGQETSAIIFPREVLDFAQLHADPTMHAALREMAERLLNESSTPVAVAERVRGLLRYESDLSTVDVPKLARGVGLTPRALRRRLATEGQSLTVLLDEARCRMACEELRRASSIKEIAERVGFSEPSAFHRAFKRWTGQTPLEYARGG